MSRGATKALLDEERARFLASRPPPDHSPARGYGGRIGVVLSGGGARGAFEAGVLLAFQDARLPTHILAATSIGSINAASYAGHSETLVGNAEHLVNSWLEVTPPAVGIFWTRYVFMLAGLIAATAGLGNLIRALSVESGFYFHLVQPELTWLMLTLAGLALLLLYDDFPYVFYVLANLVRRHSWKPQPRKIAWSLVANGVVWTCVWMFFARTHLYVSGREVLEFSPEAKALAAAGALLGLVLWWFLRDPVSTASHRALRLPLRSGLFPNFERTRFLRGRIPAEQLRNSPIRVILTAADVEAGRDAYFSNTSREALASDPGADPAFVMSEIHETDDLLKVVLASSAFPFVYEAVQMQERSWVDGGIVANQPIRPALRLGADLIFLVLVAPRSQEQVKVATFLDVGVRAIDILMSQNLKTDLKILENINHVCEHHARLLGCRPEQVVLDMGTRQYRYRKAFTVRPSEPLAATVLDFHGRITGPAIVQGYRDGCQAVRDFTAYVAHLPAEGPKHVLKFAAMPAAVAEPAHNS
ncbi:MAG TPA: patatin-like phospholipase family protein [Terriglobales bacterium]|nr:patatin-like phospholipase family protein [Terriglobales bacterium]